MVTTKLLLRAAGRFLWIALRPGPRALSTAWNLSIGVLTLALPTLLGVVKSGQSSQPPDADQQKGADWLAAQLDFWPWGVLGLLFGALVLFAVAGIRLELERVRKALVGFRLTPLDPEEVEARGYTRNQPEFTQHILVENLGPSSTIRASTASHLTGIATGAGRTPSAQYGQGVVIAWEQSTTNQRHLVNGESANLRVISTYKSQDGKELYLRLWVPPSPHTGEAYGIGTENVVIGPVSFTLMLIDADRDVSRTWQVDVTFAANGCPSMTLTELPSA